MLLKCAKECNRVFLFQRKRFSLLINLEFVIVLRRVTLRYEYHGFTHFFCLIYICCAGGPLVQFKFCLVSSPKIYKGRGLL